MKSGRKRHEIGEKTACHTLAASGEFLHEERHGSNA
jgi:hypothetical protein